ncbi:MULTISPECIES: methyltransferase [Amycolatopsis]|uniref:methyltransferase n=1 Tax=Amycolatopsis TaxID=1813 RepID=UPI000B8AE885|nr:MULTISPECIES: methyltransferase [Amycolatopsis]OXM61990.1 O-methyltransferase [Amycolatopsis sp. KNN50.9b]
MDEQGNATHARGTFNVLDENLPPEQQVLGLFYAKWILGALRAAVEVRVPDVLAAGPRTATEIAAEIGANPDALYRVLRTVAAAGILDESTDGRFALTPLSAGLVDGAENGIRDMFLFASDPMFLRPYENVAHTVRTGEPAFVEVFGMTFYDYIKVNPASGALLDRAMVQNHWPDMDRILDDFDFGRFPRIGDIGGGRGQFLARILLRHPRCTGVLADLPPTVAEAKAELENAGVADRVTVVPTDFFEEVPSGCDAYFIKHTLHNFDDDKAQLILTRIRAAIGNNADARLLIVDQLVRGPGEWDTAKLIDVEALSVLGGRERNRQEWNRITAAAGFQPVNEPEPNALVLLEYRPV